jgi:hypothetical protein
MKAVKLEEIEGEHVHGGGAMVMVAGMLDVLRDTHRGDLNGLMQGARGGRGRGLMICDNTGKSE